MSGRPNTQDYISTKNFINYFIFYRNPIMLRSFHSAFQQLHIPTVFIFFASIYRACKWHCINCEKWLQLDTLSKYIKQYTYRWRYGLLRHAISRSRLHSSLFASAEKLNISKVASVACETAVSMCPWYDFQVLLSITVFEKCLWAHPVHLKNECKSKHDKWFKRTVKRFVHLL